MTTAGGGLRVGILGLPRRVLAGTARRIAGACRFLAQRRRFLAALRTSTGPRMAVEWDMRLGDDAARSGSASGHYFHQDLLVAARIHHAAPLRHRDVGSRVDGFVAHVASFMDVEVLDVRPPPPGGPHRIAYRQVDVAGDIPAELLGATPSLSCLHALEHFGLGRYGDSIDPDGHLRGLAGLRRLLAPGGTFYLSVPIGRPRVQFNAHRVFAVPQLIAMLAGSFAVRRFSYVDDAGALHDDIPWDGAEAATSFGCEYGCGIVECRG
jgi:hypothetical protein